MPFSRKTLTRLAETCDQAFTHAGLTSLFFEYGIEAQDPGEHRNKLLRSLALLRALEGQGNDEGIRAIADTALTGEFIRKGATLLLVALALDGFEWGDSRLVPSLPGPTPLAPEITGLEGNLARLGFNVAATHYRQAVDNFSDGNFEAANGQLRSFLEDFFSVCGQLAGAQANVGPESAIQHLRNSGLVYVLPL